MTDYYAVENITQYYKEIIPEKKIEMVPVEKKVKKVQYVPIEKYGVIYGLGRLYITLRGRLKRRRFDRAGLFWGSKVSELVTMPSIRGLTPG